VLTFLKACTKKFAQHTQWYSSVLVFVLYI